MWIQFKNFFYAFFSEFYAATNKFYRYLIFLKKIEIFAKELKKKFITLDARLACGIKIHLKTNVNSNLRNFLHFSLNLMDPQISFTEI